MVYVAVIFSFPSMHQLLSTFKLPGTAEEVLLQLETAQLFPSSCTSFARMGDPSSPAPKLSPSSRTDNEYAVSNLASCLMFGKVDWIRN